jgi:RimJ/RimL family protein N-acetyltransferase
MQSTSIYTPRLELRLGTRELFSIATDDKTSLADALKVAVPDNWPVDHYDDGVREWCTKALDENADTPFVLRYVILRDEDTLVGTCGAFMPDERSVLVGYSILEQFRRRGFATEATRGLIELAWSQDGVERVIADTYPELAPSIGVMEKCGFKFAGDGDGERVIRYELLRTKGR